MRIYIVGFGDVNREILESICRGIDEVFGREITLILNEMLGLPKEAYDRLRGQYLSEPLLKEVLERAIRLRGLSGADLILLGV
ncbi:MAG: hypothetical protein QXT26_04760, partial [Thermoproteota archaeon]